MKSCKEINENLLAVAITDRLNDCFNEDELCELIRFLRLVITNLEFLFITKKRNKNEHK